jgi:cell division transport system permease protein
MMERVRYFLHESWRGLWRHRSLTVTALLALVGALLVPAVFLVVLVNALHAVESVGDRREMIVFFLDRAGDAERQAVEDTLRPVARAITFVSKEQAWDELVRELGGSELLEAAGQNPLPASLRVRLLPEYLHYEAVDTIAGGVRAMSGVEEVQFGGEWVRRYDRFLANLRAVGLAVAAVVGFVVIFVIANTIRLTIVARRDLHRVMFLLGASGRFVRLPHLLEGVLVSVIAAALSLLLVYVLIRALEPRLTILPVFLSWPWIAAFLLAAGIFGLVGSALAVSRLAREERAP